MSNVSIIGKKKAIAKQSSHLKAAKVGKSSIGKFADKHGRPLKCRDVIVTELGDVGVICAIDQDAILFRTIYQASGEGDDSRTAGFNQTDSINAGNCAVVGSFDEFDPRSAEERKNKEQPDPIQSDRSERKSIDPVEDAEQLALAFSELDVQLNHTIASIEAVGYSRSSDPLYQEAIELTRKFESLMLQIIHDAVLAGAFQR